MLKRIIYSYADADARQILARVREAMRIDSRVLIIEPVRHQAQASPFGTLLDLQMLVIGGGQVRDRHALRAGLRSARLRLWRYHSDADVGDRGGDGGMTIAVTTKRASR